MSPKRDVTVAARTPVNIAVLGASSVGKTAVTLQFITGSKVESDSCQPTIEMSFMKELHLNENCTVNTNNNIRRRQENGAECLWKTDGLSYRKSSYSDEKILSSEPKRKSKSCNDLLTVQGTAVDLKIIDTAGYKPTYNSRKSLRERLAKKLTPRRRSPVTNSEAYVRKRYLRVSEDSVKIMTPVPSFIYRQPNGKMGIHESLFMMADAFVLVYNLRDRKSFDLLTKIRNEIRLARGCICAKEEGSKSKFRPKEDRRKSNGSKMPRTSCACLSKVLPSIIVVGTHLDMTSTRSAYNSAETSKPTALDISSSRRQRKRIPLHTQVSFAVDLLRPHASDVSPAHVEGTIGSWEECVGYAEVSNDSVDRVQRLFEHLASEVICSRVRGPLQSAQRTRIDSVLSVFSRKSVSGCDNDDDDRSSWLTSCFR